MYSFIIKFIIKERFKEKLKVLQFFKLIVIISLHFSKLALVSLLNFLRKIDKEV